jgi:EmrB/QacA subfamily drug resistance transporter
MAGLDATVVNVALPHMGHDLHAGVPALQWVLTGYLLALASLILLGGALGDRIGRRRVFLVGTAWFAGASLLCGLAPTVGVVVAARVFQGIGGALLTPGSLAILQSSFREQDRAPAVGAWSGLTGVAGAIGPFVGGALVDGPGWRWAFLLNVPVAAVALLCARAVPETREPGPPRRLDLRGAAVASAGLAAATWALTEAGRRGWADPAVLLPGVGAVVLLGGFVWHIRRAASPLVPPSLFSNRRFTVVNLGTMLLYAGLGTAFFVVAFELQVAAGWSALRAGSALVPATVLMLGLSEASGSLAQRIGPRLQLTVGPVLAAAGLALLARLGTDPRWAADVLPGAMVFGLGLVAFVAPLTATVMASADAAHVGIASGVNNAVARAATLTALAVIPAAVGLSTAVEPGAVAAASRDALLACAAMAVGAAAVMFVGLGPARTRVASVTRTARRVHCAVDGPPLQPDPVRCPAA